MKVDYKMVSSNGWTSWGGAIINDKHYRGWKLAGNDDMIILLPVEMLSEDAFLYLYKIKKGKIPRRKENRMGDIVTKFNNAESNKVEPE
jgi:hypothetical protein